MVAYSFQERFIAPIQAGTKRQTIRAIGKRRHAVKNDRIQLYTGMRTARCQKIVEPDPICTGTYPIEIEVGQCDDAFVIRRIVLDGVEQIAMPDRRLIAKRDGFETLEEMADFFGDSYGPGVFRGVLITWSLTS